MFKFFMFSDFMFSDFMNTTLNNSYYSIINSSCGYLLNFSYINICVIIFFTSLYFSKFRKIPNFQNNFRQIFMILLFLVFLFLFFNILY